MNFRRYRKIICVMFFTSLALANLPLFAQAPRGGRPGPKPAQACSGAWTGSVRYVRTQSKTDTTRTERVSARGHDERRWEMKYDYKAQVAVTADPARNGSSGGKASIEHAFSSIEKIEAVERNSCDRGKTWREMRGTSSSKTETKGQAQGVGSNVHVGVNADGTYTVSVAVPQIRGLTSGEQSSTYSGQCTQKEGKTFTMPPSETNVDGNSLTSDGKDRVDPANPNKLSGSYTHSWENVVETISWNLERCGAPLRLTNLAFEDMKFPTWNEWREISEQTGTIDGNLVKIKATVFNDSGETKYADVKFKETYKGDKWNGAMPDAQLKDETVSVRVDPGELKDVELLWDSSGYAWFDDGRPRLVQRVRAELEENGKKVDEETKNLKVAPKPLILVHGYKSNWHLFESWQNILTTSHSYDWKAFPVGEKQEKGQLHTGDFATSGQRPANSMRDNASQLGSYIDYAQRDRNAWHVDVVAHSSGGLIARNYINDLMPPSDDGRPQITHLLTLGTPHLGSKCADLLYLATGEAAEYQLTTDFAEGFNRLNTNRKGVKFSALAGESVPTICKGLDWGDGFVTVASALWTIADNAKTRSVHTDLTSTADFSNFVKPRVAIGPKGNHVPDMPQTP